MVPGPNCVMLPASGHAGSIPPGYFIHPDTGKVLPEAGNLGYDLQGANLVPTTDFSSGSIRTSEAAILPYVPYPTCPATGCPPATCLPILQPRRTSQLGALMTDPATGIEVPVLAVTLHPQTRQWLTLGGTYCNPLTKTVAPLELGGPMEDPVTGSISPILGVGLDENTGVWQPSVPDLASQFPQPPATPRFWTWQQTTPDPSFHPVSSLCSHPTFVLSLSFPVPFPISSAVSQGEKKRPELVMQ
ncbi:uncharacterized protein LOC111095841 isoform X2 [Canis lupus familiaris]|uniref:uncharacterized protein LOC111095841 isoform X2 n=1 Tax=Canis lupus familiaris TaxID=9615 RepID=UPI0018F36D44|nr:uncharacterized protein LOC111095841 isoform X2 [Canis lupus familiaris]